MASLMIFYEIIIFFYGLERFVVPSGTSKEKKKCTKIPYSFGYSTIQPISSQTTLSPNIYKKKVI